MIALALAASLAGSYSFVIEGKLRPWEAATPVEMGWLVLSEDGNSCSRVTEQSWDGKRWFEHDDKGTWWAWQGPLAGARVLLHQGVDVPSIIADVHPVEAGLEGFIESGPWSMRRIQVRARYEGPPDRMLCEEPLVFLDAPPALAHLPPLLGRKKWQPSTPTPSSTRSPPSATRASTPR